MAGGRRFITQFSVKVCDFYGQINLLLTRTTIGTYLQGPGSVWINGREKCKITRANFVVYAYVLGTYVIAGGTFELN